jgi:carboxymethylenebutenolidase
MTTTQIVSFRGEEDQLQGYLAYPEGKGPFPGVVIVHEVLGLNENIRDITRRFADEGYAAFAVDLFAGRNRAVCMARFMGGMLRGTPDRFGIGDLKAALGVLAEAKHSFFNDRGKSYDPAASEDAWRRTLTFFGKHLA